MNEKIIHLFRSLSEGNGMEYSFLSIPSKPQFSFPSKLGEIGGNEILFNEIFTKTPKMPLIFFLNTRLSLFLTFIFSHLLVLPLSSQSWEFFLSFFFLDTINTIAKLTKIYNQRLFFIYIYIYHGFFF